MNIHEFQAKQLLARFGVALPAGDVCDTAEAAREIAQELFADGATLVAVKSQIHAGGRGKGTFKNGFKGGVRLCQTPDEVFRDAQAMLGNVLVTKQTGADGRLVSKLLITVAPKIRKELYLAVLLDRANSRPLIMASNEGGVDIEEVAAKTPQRIVKEWIDPAVGIQPFNARRVTVALGITGEPFSSAVKLIMGVYRTWWECDATMVEINPLCIIASAVGSSRRDDRTAQRAVPTESVMAVDAKITVDDNSLFRHADIQAMRDLNEEAPLEIEASKFNLNYIKLDGNIACLVNGAGLAMATMDIIKHYGGEPANFLDVGGGASEDQVAAAFKIIMQDPNVKGILVNIFGGIMDCNIIAKGIVQAVKETRLKLPLVVRLEGNNVVAGRKTLAASGLKLITGDSMADAAQESVKVVTR